MLNAAGFVGVRFGRAVDVFSGSAHESDAAEFGTRGFAIFGRRPAHGAAVAGRGAA